jgi:hypothetical protein
MPGNVKFQGKLYYLQAVERKSGFRLAEEAETENQKPDAWIILPESGDRRIYPNQRGDLNCG